MVCLMDNACDMLTINILEGAIEMPDLNGFYAFKMSGGSSGKGGGGIGCGTIAIIVGAAYMLLELLGSCSR